MSWGDGEVSFTSGERDRIKAKIVEAIGMSYGAVGFKSIDFAKHHNLSLQTVYRYLQKLEDEGKIIKKRVGKNNVYSLADKTNSFRFNLNEISEDGVWREHIYPLLKNLPENALKNCNYAFTEMLNNAIDHSDGTNVEITVLDNSFRVILTIQDNGVGIFSKIADAFKLKEKRFAVLELAKGKFTTDPGSHSGEGIFFSSKAADTFAILSDDLLFAPISNSSIGDIDSLLLDYRKTPAKKGTDVAFLIRYEHKQTLKEIFDKYTGAPDDYGFTKTKVPVKLLEYGDEAALFTSRSQAKRLIARFDKFNYIELDFSDIDEIGQGFADEIFRVFSSIHPDIKLLATNCSQQISNMIRRAKRQ